MNRDEMAGRFVHALAAKEWGSLEELFQPAASFRALIPPGIREASGGAGAAAQFQGWFGKADAIELLDLGVEPVQDKVRIGYRLRLHTDRWYICQQQAFCVLTGGRIEKMDLLCSGFRPEPPVLEGAAAERAGSPSS